jgi:CHAT domain-containing protein
MVRPIFFLQVMALYLSVGILGPGSLQSQEPTAKPQAAHQIDDQIDAFLLEGDNEKSEQRLQAAAASYRNALQLADKENRKTAKAHALMKFASLAAIQGNSPWALKALGLAIPLLDEQENGDLLSQALVQRGQYETLTNGFGKAVDSFLKAIEIARRQHNTVILAEASIGLLPPLGWSGRYDDALAYGAAGLSLCAHINAANACFRDAFDGLSDIYDALGQYDNSCKAAIAAIGFREQNTNYLFPVSNEESRMVECLRQKKYIDAAISIGISAVNIDQTRRSMVAGRITDVRSQFAWMTAFPYQQLADILFQQGSIDQGEYILDLLKTVSVSRSDTFSIKETETLPVSHTDLQRVERLIETSDHVSAATKAQLAIFQLTWEQLTFDPGSKLQLRTHLETIFQNMKESDQLLSEFASSESRSKHPLNLPHSSITSIVKASGPGVMALYTLSLRDRIGVAITTADGFQYVMLKQDGKDVGQIALLQAMVRNVGTVRDSAQDPWQSLNELHKMIVGSLGPEIARVAAQSPDKVPTLLWCLDGVLRFIPINALFDGKRYFVEQARNVLIAPNEQLNKSRLRGARPEKILAAGKTTFGGVDTLEDLDNVAAELNAVARDPTVSESHGPIRGRILLDRTFTVPTFAEAMKQNPDVIHLATHFVHKVGDNSDSTDGYLFLTDESDPTKVSKLSIADFQDTLNIDLSGAELITLSACSTGEPNEISSFQDVDSLATVLRRRGARSVLAPLWKTDDTASRLFMASFYAYWSSHPQLGKIEALRQTQLKMLNGEIGRKLEKVQGILASPDPHRGYYAHPFYWATYELNGDFR